MRVVVRLVHQLSTVKLRSVHAVKEFLPSVSVAYECECSETHRLFVVICYYFVREYAMQCSTEDFCVGNQSMESIIENLDDDV
jgi:hypothetical protein